MSSVVHEADTEFEVDSSGMGDVLLTLEWEVGTITLRLSPKATMELARGLADYAVEEMKLSQGLDDFSYAEVRVVKFEDD